MFEQSGQAVPQLLVCSDLDRTLIPNGPQEESYGSRGLFRDWVQRDEILVAYVSGRRLDLQLGAIEAYDLPVPDWIVADVGSRIFEFHDDCWVPVEPWDRLLREEWPPGIHDQVRRILKGEEGFSLQPREAQSEFKVSFHSRPEYQSQVAKFEELLVKSGISASLVWSVDETTNTGLLDVLPSRASKLHAIRFLLGHSGMGPERVLFAGDSGNDIPVLVSEIPSVLVGNATDEVREAALEEACRFGHEDCLYLARGGFLGMNGNYSAGLLEGWMHFYPNFAGDLRVPSSSADS